ncbi:MAG: site-specific integrase [Sphingobium sp.]|nr:site-specific integrase [Sphingobium sp.]MBP9156965.1 site-specific integrase [Sphingobium sp.]
MVERDLSTREARKRLPVRAEPYWRNEGEGQHIGYYRGARVGKWVARYRLPGASGGYSKTTIGEADDVVGREADGERVFTWKQAKARAVIWFAEMDAAGGIKLGKYTVADACDDYMDRFQGKDRKNTQRRIDVLIKPDLGNYEVSKLSASIIGKWLSDLAKRPARLRTSKTSDTQNYRPLESEDAKRKRRSTANRDMTVLKAALNAAYIAGRVASDDAWRRVKPFAKADRARLRYLSDEEARKLVTACDPIFRPLLQAALLTGMRYQEVARARVGDFDAKAMTIAIPDSKAGVQRFAYLDKEGVAFFKQLMTGKTANDLLFPRPDGGQWGDSQQIRYLKNACKKGKIEPAATFHDLRRTYGARLAVRGVSMAVIAEAIGNADERITRRHYAHLAPSYVSDTVRKNIVGLGITETAPRFTGTVGED